MCVYVHTLFAFMYTFSSVITLLSKTFTLLFCFLQVVREQTLSQWVSSWENVLKGRLSLHHRTLQKWPEWQCAVRHPEREGRRVRVSASSLSLRREVCWGWNNPSQESESCQTGPQVQHIFHETALSTKHSVVSSWHHTDICTFLCLCQRRPPAGPVTWNTSFSYIHIMEEPAAVD